MGHQEGLVCLSVFALVVTLIVLGVVQLALVVTSGDPQYTVAVTGFAGLEDLAAAGDKPPRTLSPVFNLSVRVDNSRDKTSEACVRAHSAAVVSYGDAFVVRGSVPAFCAGARRAEERGATAWGQGVAVPRFLRERLAGELQRGEAAVDVQVTISPASCASCHDLVLVCRPKIEGGPSPCRLDSVYLRPAPVEGSTA